MSNITLKNVTTNFPHLFVFGKNPDGSVMDKYAIALEFDVTDAGDKKLVDLIKEELQSFHKSAFAGVSGVKLALVRVLDENGEPTSKYKMNARSKKKPIVLNRDLSPVTADDGLPFSGAKCNVQFSFWKQDNAFGKRINAELLIVQYVSGGVNYDGATADLSAMSEVDI